MTAGLCAVFQELADQTTQRIKAAHDSGMRWSEESNTEHLLLTLATRHPSQVAISAFTKRREAANGADWEWWFLGASGAYGMRVQAKRIALPNEIFSHLRHRAKGHSRDQMTALIEEAKRDGLTPAYCFYTASRHSPVGGCLIGHAQIIEQVIGRPRGNGLRQLSRYLMPWHMLICGGVGTDISQAADIAMQDVAAWRQPSEQGLIQDLVLADRHKIAPTYVRELAANMDPARGGLTGHRQTADNEVLFAKGIRGVVVFRDTGH